MSTSDDVSRLFPYAATLLASLQAKAVVVLSYGSATGMNGCAPAIVLDMRPTAEAARHNTHTIRTIAGLLRTVADSLEDDTRAKGVPLEARS